jgi:hypothetical protein
MEWSRQLRCDGDMRDLRRTSGLSDLAEGSPSRSAGLAVAVAALTLTSVPIESDCHLAEPGTPPRLSASDTCWQREPRRLADAGEDWQVLAVPFASAFACTGVRAWNRLTSPGQPAGFLRSWHASSAVATRGQEVPPDAR